VGVARQIFSIVLVFTLLVLTLRKAGRSRISFLARFKNLPVKSRRTLEPIDRLALTQQHTLHVVRIDGRDVVLATHTSGCTVLTYLDLARGDAPNATAGGPAV
jgi:flagellar biosynthesis protein FliO